MSNDKKAKYFKDNSARNAARQAARVAKEARNKCEFRGSARAVRRAAGDYAPVNKVASLQQAPDSKFARKLTKHERNVILGISLPKEEQENHPVVA